MYDANIVSYIFLTNIHFYLAEKEQTPLQEALYQLIRQLQRYVGHNILILELISLIFY